MSDPLQNLNPDQDRISPQLKEYLRYKLNAAKEETARVVSSALDHFRQTHPGMRDTEELVNAMKELNRRIEVLGRQLAAHINLHASQARATAKYRPSDRGWPRGVDGRLEDPMLRALAARKTDLGLTQQELADILEVKRRALSHWLNRRCAPRGAEYDRVKAWVEEMDGVSAADFRAWQARG